MLLPSKKEDPQEGPLFNFFKGIARLKNRAEAFLIEDVARGICGSPVDADGVMQVGGCGPARFTHPSNDIPTSDHLTRLEGGNALQVSVDRTEILAVVYCHVETEMFVRADLADHAVGCGKDGRPNATGDIQPIMKLPPACEGVRSIPET